MHYALEENLRRKKSWAKTTIKKQQQQKAGIEIALTVNILIGLPILT